MYKCNGPWEQNRETEPEKVIPTVHGSCIIYERFFFFLFAIHPTVSTGVHFGAETRATNLSLGDGNIGALEVECALVVDIGTRGTARVPFFGVMCVPTAVML